MLSVSCELNVLGGLGLESVVEGVKILLNLGGVTLAGSHDGAQIGALRTRAGDALLCLVVLSVEDECNSGVVSGLSLEVLGCCGIVTLLELDDSKVCLSLG